MVFPACGAEQAGGQHGNVCMVRLSAALPVQQCMSCCSSLSEDACAGDQHGNIRVWDLTANACSCELVPEVGTAVRSLTVALDGSLVVAANNAGAPCIRQLIPCARLQCGMSCSCVEHVKFLEIYSSRNAGLSRLNPWPPPRFSSAGRACDCSGYALKLRTPRVQRAGITGSLVRFRQARALFVLLPRVTKHASLSLHMLLLKTGRLPPGTCYVWRMMRGSSLTTHFEPLHKLRAHAGMPRICLRLVDDAGISCFQLLTSWCNSSTEVVLDLCVLSSMLLHILISSRAAGKYVLKCLLSPDVRQLATTSADKTIKLWNLDGFTLDRTLVGTALTYAAGMHVVLRHIQWSMTASCSVLRLLVHAFREHCTQ